MTAETVAIAVIAATVKTAATATGWLGGASSAAQPIDTPRES